MGNGGLGEVGQNIGSVGTGLSPLPIFHFMPFS